MTLMNIPHLPLLQNIPRFYSQDSGLHAQDFIHSRLMGISCHITISIQIQLHILSGILF